MRFANVSLFAIAAGLLFCSSPARAQNQGFTLNRYEPTPAGEWSFLVDHPWYSSTRYFAAGVTLNYAHNPLFYGLTDAEGNYGQQQVIINHQLLGHLDLAGSFLDRVTLSASLPVTFLERGQALGGITPTDGVVVGDPRFGIMVRLWGQPDRSPFSISVGGYVWVPLRGFDTSLPQQSSDSEVRFLPKIVLAGLGKRIRWSLNLGFLYRPDAVIGNFTIPDGSSAGSSLQVGASIQYADTAHRFAIGPEALFSTQVLHGYAFRLDFTSLEVLLGAHYNIARQVQLGLAGGLGVLREAGTPDFRGLFRIAYAPIRDTGPRIIDTDKDGVQDKQDACPQEPGPTTTDPRTNGCPVRDRDQDGVVDELDLCPEVAQGSHPDPAKLGCPDPDHDHDGVLDEKDQCPDVAQGEHPDPAKLGCPDKDTDGDGVYDAQDQCPRVHASAHPDPAKLGCPLPDRDGDSVVDAVDACPDKPGAPDPDPKKNGCPGLTAIKRGQIIIFRPVFFANDEDVILKNSFPVMQAVANALIAEPEITKVAIEGHTDDRGEIEHNVDLSDRRARSVMRWLAEHGVAASRLAATGYGPKRPISDNKTLYGRAKNRRVEFHILEPAVLAEPGRSEGAPAGVKVIPATPAPPKGPAVDGPEPGPSPSPADEAPSKRRHGRKAKAGVAAADATAEAAKPAKKKHEKKKQAAEQP